MAGAKAEGEPREVELKLDGEPEAIERLRDHPLLRGRARTERLSATYFDTDDLALKAAGISLRIRRGENGSVQTIKAARGAGLALDRSEWDHPVADGALDLSAAAGTALGPLVADGRVRGALRPRFTVEVERTAVTLRRDGSALELALDRGEVATGDGAARPIAEVELELKHGRPAALFGVARTLAEAVPLRLNFKAKSERGYDLLAGERPKPTKAEPLRLAPGTTSGEAFRAIGRSCLRQYVANEAVLRAERNPDAVHQMRVALRRLRAAVTLFKDAVADGERDAVRAELKRVANELGPARDLDVFVAKTVRPALARHGNDPAFAALLADAEARREAAYDRALAAVLSGDFARSALRAAAWIEAGDWLGSEDARAARDRPVAQHAAAELDRRWRRVRRRAKGLRRLSPEARHEVRIEIKKLRYAAEFFASLFDGAPRAKARKAALATLETLQEVLGDLNDIAVASAEPATGALATLQAEQAERVEPLVAEAKATVRAFRGLEPFWRG